MCGRNDARHMTAVLDKGANLPLTQNIDLDGSATIEVQYL